MMAPRAVFSTGRVAQLGKAENEKMLSRVQILLPKIFFASLDKIFS